MQSNATEPWVLTIRATFGKLLGRSDGRYVGIYTPQNQAKKTFME